MKTQLEDLEPGELCKVRCVTVDTFLQSIKEYKRIENIPILPYPPHSDLEIIGFAPVHYHFDYRFFTIELAQDILELDCFSDSEDWASRIQLEEEVIGEPYDRDLVCEREPVIAGDWYDFVAAVEDHYEHTRLTPNQKGCFVCPHRGYVLNKITPESLTNKAIKPHHTKAVFACPGHGLIFDRCGGVIRRTKRRSTEWEPGRGGINR